VAEPTAVLRAIATARTMAARWGTKTALHGAAEMDKKWERFVGKQSDRPWAAQMAAEKEDRRAGRTAAPMVTAKGVRRVC
jgi:hypothetical protein